MFSITQYREHGNGEKSFNHVDTIGTGGETYVFPFMADEVTVYNDSPNVVNIVNPATTITANSSALLKLPTKSITANSASGLSVIRISGVKRVVGNLGLTSLSNTVVILGDSITRKYTSNLNVGNDSYFAWANMYLKQRLKVLNNAGVSGETTAQILARLKSNVIDYQPGWCVVEGGVNDVIGNVSASTIQSNLKTIYETLTAAGIRAVATTITPYDPATTAQKNTIYRVNQWIKDYCWSNPRVILCDWSPVVADPATGNWIATFTSDGTHPTVEGAQRMGEMLANTLSPFIPYIDLLPSNNSDPDNLCPSAMFTGNVAGLATSWNVTGGGTYALSKVTRTDGRQGEWQQVNQTVAGANRLQLYIQQTDTTKFAVGDQIYAMVEFETDNSLVSPQLALKVAEEGGSNSNAWAPFGTNADVFPYLPRAGVIRTFPFTVTNGSVRLRVDIYIGGTGTFRFGRVKMAKITV